MLLLHSKVVRWGWAMKWRSNRLERIAPASPTQPMLFSFYQMFFPVETLVGRKAGQSNLGTQEDRKLPYTKWSISSVFSLLTVKALFQLYLEMPGSESGNYCIRSMSYGPSGNNIGSWLRAHCPNSSILPLTVWQWLSTGSSRGLACHWLTRDARDWTRENLHAKHLLCQLLSSHSRQSHN